MWTAEQRHDDTLGATFEETIRPKLIAILRESLPSWLPINHRLSRDAPLKSLPNWGCSLADSTALQIKDQKFEGFGQVGL
jgi:hypothetical protein